MNFHKKYKINTPWWRFITTEFELLYNHQRMTGLFNYDYDDEFVRIERNGMVTAKNGFIFGASGPTIDTRSSREASCIHDAIYHLSKVGLFKGKDSDRMREIADELLFRVCIENSMWRLRAKVWLKVLDMFGGIAWEGTK